MGILNNTKCNHALILQYNTNISKFTTHFFNQSDTNDAQKFVDIAVNHLLEDKMQVSTFVLHPSKAEAEAKNAKFEIFALRKGDLKLEPTWTIEEFDTCISLIHKIRLWSQQASKNISF